MTAYERGEKAYYDGRHLDDNPYRRGTAAHDAWSRGYRQACYDNNE